MKYLKGTIILGLIFTLGLSSSAGTVTECPEGDSTKCAWNSEFVVYKGKEKSLTRPSSFL
jgi:hypothetical protein